MNTRRIQIVVAGCVLAGGLLAASTPTGSALTSGSGSATSQAAQSSAGTISTPVVTAKLLGIINLGEVAKLTTNLATPLINLPGTLVTALANGITGSGLSATNPSTAQGRPSSTYSFPTCGQQGWTTPGDCYGPTVSGVSTSAIALTVGATQGYATGDTAGYVAAAETADPNLTLLGINIGDLGVIDSSAACSSASVCAPDQKLSGGSLFGGALTYSIANGKVVAKVGSVTVGTTPVTVTSAVKATVSATNLLTLSITVSTTQLLGGLGDTLATLGTLLGGTLVDAGTTATLSVTIGPGNTTTAGASATAWGLDVNASLTADVKFNLTVLGLGLLNLETTASGQLIDLKLAYSNATAGSLLPSWIPPGLI